MSLFRSKAEQKLVDKGLDPSRLPPGQYLTEKWPVLHAGTVPQTDLATWDFKVFGEIEEPPHARLRRAAGATADGDHHRHPLRHTLEPVRHVIQRSALAGARRSSYTPKTERRASSSRTPSRASPSNVPLAALEDDNALVAWEADGEPLEARPRLAAAPRRPLPLLLEERQVAEGHRAPPRLINQGFWERYGYHNEADYWKEQRYGF